MTTRTLDSDGVRRTLDRLRDRRPELAETLSAAIDADLAAALAPDGLPAPARLEPPRVDGRPLATFVLGCGRGGVVRGLAAALSGTDSTAIVIVVETDPARLLATLTADDWETAISEPRVRFAVGPDPRATVPAAIPDAPCALLERGMPPGVGLVPGDASERADAIRAALDTAATIEMADFKRRCDEQAAARRRGESPPRLPSGPWRIHTSVSTATTAIKHLAPSILRAAARATHRTSVHLAESGTDPFVSSRSAMASLTSEADLVVGFLRPGRTVIPWRDDFPSLVYVSSNPGLLPIETFDWSERDLVVVTEDAFAEPYRPLGLEPLVRPLATEVPDRSLLRGDAGPPCDVLVVGNIPSAITVAPGLTDNLLALIEDMADDWVRHPDATIDEVLATTTIRGDDEFMTGVRLALGYEATRRRRIGAVVTLAEAGFVVRVHGEESWRDRLTGTAAEGCWQGWMSTADQHAAFHQAGVSISVNSFAAMGSLNMRSFAIPAAAGVLVSDDRPPLQAAFDIGREALSFRRLGELPDLVADVLRDRDRRDAIAAAGRARVERDHSWDAWWAWAEARLRERFGGRE